mmetsp:Transcript_7488/g.14205  ORF Transcript_7488/g.14205 Transcript_7488/m.14205 type:complete len:241 (-) Transcript_7488:1718-2440(-)
MKLPQLSNVTAFLAACVSVASAFNHHPSFSISIQPSSRHGDNDKATQTLATTKPSLCNEHAAESRRSILKQSSATIFSALIVGSMTPSQALAYPQEKTDKENLVKGYKRLQYLLDNWEKETTICGRSDNPYIGCERTPEKVMEYLGYKSMKDPLFKADKTMLRLQSLVSSNDEVDYMEAMELFNEKAEEASNTAFVSSWGEANPGGGKDRVAFFIERSRKQVETARDSLGTVIKILGIEV